MKNKFITGIMIAVAIAGAWTIIDVLEYTSSNAGGAIVAQASLEAAGFTLDYSDGFYDLGCFDCGSGFEYDPYYTDFGGCYGGCGYDPYYPPVYEPPIYYPPIYQPPIYQPPTYTPQPTCTLSSTQTSVIAGTPVALSWSSANATSGSITNIGSVSTFGSYTVTPQVTTTYVGTFVGQGGSTSCQTTVVVQPKTPPTCTLSVTQYPTKVGDPATITWTTQNADTISISNVGSVNTGSGSRTVYPSAGTTNYVATVSGQGGSATCQASVTVQNVQQQPYCSMYFLPTSVAAGGQATLYWTTHNATSFHINQGVSSVNTGSGSRVVYPYTTTTYTGTVYGSNGQQQTCSATIGVYAASPNVTLFQQPGDQPLASVSLTQVPYTGFAAGPVVTFIFWFAIVLWSIGLTYIFMGKRGFQFVARKVFAYEPATVGYSASVAAPVAHGTREDEFVNGFDHVTATDDVDTPATADAGETDVREVIESRAHAVGVLMSPEAVTAALELAPTAEEVLNVFGDIINDAVRTLPRQDGWVLLSSDAFETLAAKYTGSAAAEAPELSKEDLSV